MPSAKSYADVIRDWQVILDAAERSPDVQASIETERQSLAQSLVEVEGLKARQDELKALRQQLTQQLTAAVARGKETALQVRSVVRGKIGPKSERLVHFNVAPLRKRSRKKKEETKKPSGESPGTASGGTAAGTTADSPSDKPVA